MSNTQLIYQEIAKIPLGEPFTLEKFKQNAAWRNIQRLLSRLTKSGELTRIEKGIYAKPRIFKGVEVVRTGKPLIECIEQTTGETVVTSGPHAINILGISSQGQMHETYYWTGRSKAIDVDGVSIKLKYINKQYANKAHPLLELLLSAAYFLGKEMFTLEALSLVEQRLGKSRLFEMKQYLALMPKWVMLVFTQYFNSQTSGDIDG